MAMTAKFLRIARQGRNSWKRFLVGVLLPYCLTLIVWYLISMVTSYILGFPLNEERTNLLLNGNPLRTSVLLGLTLIIYLFGLYLYIKRVHKRKFTTLFTSEDSVRWQRMIKGFGVYLGLYSIRFLLWYLIAPSRYILHFNASEWLPFTLLSLVFAPIFALSVVLFYAYLLQGIGLLIRSPLLLSIVCGLIFSLIDGSLYHAFIASEPESLISWFTTVVIWTFMAWVIIKDNGIELMLGWNTAVILIFLVWASVDDSDVFNPPTIFKATEPLLPLYYLVTVLLHMGLFYYICFGIGKKLSASTPEE
jgi:hypothetical protein